MERAEIACGDMTIFFKMIFEYHDLVSFPPRPCNPSLRARMLKKEQSRLKWSFSIEDFNLARKVKALIFREFLTKKALVGGPLEISTCSLCHLVLSKNSRVLIC